MTDQIQLSGSLSSELREGLSVEEILAYIPQQEPFRFIDEILFVNQEEISGTYRFKEDEFFYRGHFPGKPITPGVILLESMCQIGVVAFGIYLLSKSIAKADLGKWLTMFADAEVEFFKPVYPGDRVTVLAKKKFWRKMKLSAAITMYNDKGDLVAAGIASGVGVAR